MISGYYLPNIMKIYDLPKAHFRGKSTYPKIIKEKRRNLLRVIHISLFISLIYSRITGFIFQAFGLSYLSYFYNPNTWLSGILLIFFLMAIAFMGYVLPFGQMSFWGATVITNLLSPFPSLRELAG